MTVKKDILKNAKKNLPGCGFRFKDKCVYNNPGLKTKKEHNQKRGSECFGEDDGSIYQKG